MSSSIEISKCSVSLTILGLRNVSQANLIEEVDSFKHEMRNYFSIYMLFCSISCNFEKNKNRLYPKKKKKKKYILSKLDFTINVKNLTQVLCISTSFFSDFTAEINNKSTEKRQF